VESPIKGIMDLKSLVGAARKKGASDLHLEPGLPPAIRVRGMLEVGGEALPAGPLLALAREIIGEDLWPQFLERRSLDLSKTIAGVRCRINVLQSSRGVGMAIRLLAPFQATIERLNLLPDLRMLVNHQHGLILVCGPTGSGKSSTLAALIQEVNLREARHIVTVESPIEYTIHPRKSYIRQREVGRDTPSFEQALLDALREDPDVIMVGELREPETMRLTLNAAETGHLVIATVHSGTCIEALQRIVSSFPAEIQNAVCSQLADSLIGVITQRLRFRSDLNIRVPECEVLLSSHPVKAHIRSREFFKLASVMETGADAGMWTFQRYQNWLEKRKDWYLPSEHDDDVPDSEPAAATVSSARLAPLKMKSKEVSSPSEGSAALKASAAPTEGAIEIEPVEGGLEELIKKLGE